MKNRKQTCLLAMATAFQLTIATTAWCQQQINVHGTCIILASNNGNMALAADSAISAYDQDGRYVGHSLGCKPWFPNKVTIAATSGQFRFGPPITGLDADLSALLLMGKVSSSSLPNEVDTALINWGAQITDYLQKNPQYVTKKDGELASLSVGFRHESINYIYKQRITSHDRHVMVEPVRFEAADDGIALLLSGSCRNYIRGGGGERAIEISPAEAVRLNNLASYIKSDQMTSVDQLGQTIVNYEQALIEISMNHPTDPNNKEEIGPPIQLATLPKDSSNWISSFSSPCSATTEQPKPHKKQSK
jgi:hypothetical protein